jgi:capsular polysaccharide biosynthesis protein
VINNKDKEEQLVFREEEVIDLRTLFKTLHKWRKVIILGTLLAVLTSGVLSFFFMQPVYQAKTLVMVTQPTDRQRVVERGGLEEVMAPLARGPVMTMDTYVGQIKSEALMQRVIDKLHLDYRPGGLLGAVEATIIRDTNLIEVRVQHTDPVLARDVANTINAEYLEMLSEKNEEQMARSVNFLERQRDEAEQQLAHALAETKKFETQLRSVALLEREFAHKSDDFAQHRSRLSLAVVEQRQIDAGVAQMETELDTLAPTVTVERLDADGEMITVQEPNPAYLSLFERLSQRRAAQAERGAEVEMLTQLLATLEGEIGALLSELTGKRAELERLQAEAERLETTVNLLAQKVTETQIARAIDLGEISVTVVSPANTPTAPIKPNKQLNIMLSLVLGLMVFVGLAFLLEYLDYTIKTPEDVERHLELPVLGVVPAADVKTLRRSTY